MGSGRNSQLPDLATDLPIESARVALSGIVAYGFSTKCHNDNTNNSNNNDNKNKRIVVLIVVIIVTRIIITSNNVNTKWNLSVLLTMVSFKKNLVLIIVA